MTQPSLVCGFMNMMSGTDSLASDLLHSSNTVADLPKVTHLSSWCSNAATYTLLKMVLQSQSFPVIDARFSGLVSILNSTGSSLNTAMLNQIDLTLTDRWLIDACVYTADAIAAQCNTSCASWASNVGAYTSNILDALSSDTWARNVTSNQACLTKAATWACNISATALAIAGSNRQTLAAMDVEIRFLSNTAVWSSNNCSNS